MKATLAAINRMRTDGVIGKYAIGGAVGATLYLEPLATLDIDIFVSLPGPPGAALLTLSPIYDYLTSRGHKIDREYLVIEGWPVQFLPPADALEEEALQQAVEVDVEGTPTWVITAEHLAALALKTGRAKDVARLLQFVEAGVLDASKLDAILKRHALIEGWREFEAKFVR
jgi:hypothetical protein